ncbi:hypothetical protein [Conexibacter sp. S30A1]|uniref:hypothetical protein n=1 Tax=Conexibacter sp. S30A1 TaxID=2937800 RepID=UPI00200D3937|nr:hypothetical protein [Conexibacter sp. S30A1]
MTATESDTLAALRRAREQLDNTQTAISALVAEARAQGASWQGIGDALGITRQSAWERFGKREQAADNGSPEGGN